VASSHSQAAEKALDSQALAAFGAACIDHGTATTGFHTDQKAVGTGATCFGWLVGAFHNSSFVPNAMDRRSAKPKIIANFQAPGKSSRFNDKACSSPCATLMWFMMPSLTRLGMWISS
jgi:hypothetical protein